MPAAVIGGIASLVSAAVGAAGSAINNKNAASLISGQKAENRKWYNAKEAEDGIGRKDSQAILKKQREIFDEQLARSREINAKMDGGEGAMGKMYSTAAQSVSDTMTNMAGQQQSRVDTAEAAFRQTDNTLTTQQAALKQQQAANIAKAASTGIQAGLGLIGSGIEGSETRTLPTTATTPTTDENGNVIG